MTTREGYIAAQSVLGLVGPLIVVLGMILAGVLLKPDKLVRTMFPYINKHGNNTVMFGFIIKDTYIIFLFVIMLINIYFTMAIFFAHVLIVRSETYNPLGGFDCFDENGEEINSTTIEEAFELRKSNRTIECYAWQLNIAGAVGQATGTLLFSWAVVSVVTWIILKTHKKISKSKYEQVKNYKNHILGAIQLGIYMIPAAMTASTAVLRSLRVLSLLNYLELLAFCIVLWASTMVLHCFLTEELETIEELIDEKVKKKVDIEQRTDSNEGAGEIITRKDITTTYKENIKKLIEEMAELESKRAVTDKVAVYLEEDMKTVTKEAFCRVRKIIKKDTESPLATAEGTSNAIMNQEEQGDIQEEQGDNQEEQGDNQEEQGDNQEEHEENQEEQGDNYCDRQIIEVVVHVDNGEQTEGNADQQEDEGVPRIMSTEV